MAIFGMKNSKIFNLKKIVEITIDQLLERNPSWIFFFQIFLTQKIKFKQ